jgi:hypothetical protein
MQIDMCAIGYSSYGLVAVSENVGDFSASPGDDSSEELKDKLARTDAASFVAADSTLPME